MPTGPDEGADPYAITVQAERPSPIYVNGDENEIPDLVITDTTDKRILVFYDIRLGTNIFQAFEYSSVSSIVYRCWRKYRADNRNHWKIEITITGTVAGKTVLSKVYPFGAAGYNFDPADISWYGVLNFKF